MPSPQSQDRYSNGSILRSSTGAAIRRGTIKISDPLPYDQDVQNIATRHDSDWPIKTPTNTMQRGRHYSTGNLEPGDAGRASMGPSLIPSSTSTAPSKGSISHKKQTGFRATLRRMFGSKKGRGSMEDRRKEYHRSDPGNLTSIAERSADARVTRVPSQAGTGVTRTSALGSHGLNLDFTSNPGPDDQIRLPASAHRRRNTLPSLVITDQMAEILAGSGDQDRASRTWRRESKSPSDGYLKRRSRSADALDRMISDFNLRNASRRDRQANIAYWRKSIVDNPLPAWPPWRDRTESSAPLMGMEEMSSEVTPLQNFDFGLERAEGQEVTLEDRVNTLEVKVMDFEYAITKLQGQNVPALGFQQKVPKRRSIHDLFPQQMDSGMTSSSSLEPTSFLTSPDDSPMPQEDACRPDRSSKATTIRPLTARRRSRADSPSPVRITVDQFDRLMDILRREQNARRQLETQVNELQQELELLRSPVYAEIRDPSAYPSPDSRRTTPATSRTLRRSPPFSSEEKAAEQSRFSMSELDSDTDGDDVYETPHDKTFMFENPRSSPMIGAN